MRNTTRGWISTDVVLPCLAAALLFSPVSAGSFQEHPGGRRLARHSGHTARPAEKAGPLSAEDAGAIAERWGIRIDRVQLSAAGYMLDFRYSVVDARKATPLFERRTKPVLRDEATGAEMAVPVPPKTGALRNSNAPHAGRSYFMFFANPGRFVKPGRLVTITIGAFSVGGIAVQSGSAEQSARTTGHDGHTPSAAAPPAATLLAPQPVIGEIPLVDSHNRLTSLRDALDTDDPVFVNFIFTSCTTVCPIMSAGFAQFHDRLGTDRDRVRLVSISIDPEVDTAAALAAYAARYRAGASWQFLTGTAPGIEAALRAFGAYRGDKTNHAPATYVRRGRTAPWQVVSGLSSAETLLSLVRGPS